MTLVQEYVEAVFSGKGVQALKLYLSNPGLTDDLDKAVWERLQRKEEQHYDQQCPQSI